MLACLIDYATMVSKLLSNLMSSSSSKVVAAHDRSALEMYRPTSVTYICNTVRKNYGSSNLNLLQKLK